MLSNWTHEVFESVAWAWGIWFLSLVLFALITIVALNGVRWTGFRRIHQDEDGVAYTLSYVMVVPIYLILMLTVVEMTMFLMAKMGTVYAAYSGARSAVVWIPSSVSSTARGNANRAAVNAMTPFSNGYVDLNAARRGETSGDLDLYLNAYKELTPSDHRVSDAYFRAKYLYANRAVDAQIERTEVNHTEKWNADITVTANYRFPFNVPLIGRLFKANKDERGQYYLPVGSRATLQLEAPQNEKQSLGIGYASP